MNGKVKSQSTYAQNDLKNPISYTLNYYKLQNDLNGQKKLSSTVAAVDSISGRVKTNAEMGKEVEIMVDVREQVSTSISSSVELNLDVTSFFLL
ncbi:MAG: hypothetical protein IPP79_05070 [Chitinophagaceae bacterium]|nr:hypothetical protein [Chitinophagaceae bacterium]